MDTYGLSEFTRRLPGLRVIDWLTSIEEEKLFISVITPGEIQRGIESLPDSHCKMELLIWMNNGLLTRFAEQMVTIDRLKPALSTAIQNGMACGRFQSIRRTRYRMKIGMSSRGLLVDHCLPVIHSITSLFITQMRVILIYVKL